MGSSVHIKKPTRNMKANKRGEQMQYTITGKNTYRVEFTTKPEGYLDFLKKNPTDEKDPIRKGVPVVVNVTVEKVTGDLKDVPEVIMSHAAKDINVSIASTIRPMAGVGTYQERLERLKKALVKPLEYTATLETARKGAKKSISVLDTLLMAYGAQKLAKHLIAIAGEIQSGGAAKEIISKWATIMEKENLK